MRRYALIQVLCRRQYKFNFAELLSDALCLEQIPILRQYLKRTVCVLQIIQLIVNLLRQTNPIVFNLPDLARLTKHLDLF